MAALPSLSAWARMEPWRGLAPQELSGVPLSQDGGWNPRVEPGQLREPRAERDKEPFLSGGEWSTDPSELFSLQRSNTEIQGRH